MCQGMATMNSTGQVERYRLVTRSDFDGLVCAALLKQLGMLDDILFVHPKDMQDGKVEVSGRDITTNLPYVPGVHLAFDHHDSELERLDDDRRQPRDLRERASRPRAWCTTTSAAPARFPGVSTDLMDAVDKADAAQFSEDEILDPAGWIFLSFLMDPRTGLGRFRDFRISNYQLMLQLIDACTQLTADQVLASPDVAERVDLYWEHASAARNQIERCATVHGNLVVLDLRDEVVIHPTNRFQVYALFPECNGLDARALGPASSRTRCSPSASRSSTARARRTSARSCSSTAAAATGGRHLPDRQRARGRRAGGADRRDPAAG